MQDLKVNTTSDLAADYWLTAAPPPANTNRPVAARRGSGTAAPP